MGEQGQMRWSIGIEGNEKYRQENWVTRTLANRQKHDKLKALQAGRLLEFGMTPVKPAQ